MTTTRKDTMSTIAWADCDVCHHPIGPDDEVVVELPDHGAIHDVREARAADEHAEPARWRLAHEQCSDRANTTAYDLTTTAEIRTKGDLDYWTNHLQRKSWFHLTDWHEFIARAVR